MIKILSRGQYLDHESPEPRPVYDLKLGGDDELRLEVAEILSQSGKLSQVRWDQSRRRYTFIWTGPPLLDSSPVWTEVNRLIGNFSLKLEREAASPAQRGRY